MSAVAGSSAPLFSPTFIQDPYPTYRMFLDGPAIQAPIPPPPHALVFQYGPCATLFRDPRFVVAARLAAYRMVTGEDMKSLPDLCRHMSHWLLFRDPPDHTRLRKLMNAGFSPLATERLRATVEGVVDELLSAIEISDEPDIVRDLAFPLPVRVISRLLGVPREREPECVELSDAIALWWGSRDRTMEMGRAAETAAKTLAQMFGAIIRERRMGQGDELMDLLLRIARDGGGMNVEELEAQCVLLLLAGHETTRNLIGNALYTLLQHPRVLAEVHDDDAAVRPAIEEVLRYESPVQGTGRFASQDIDFQGQRIAKGSYVIFMLGAAHRDPRQFAEPDSFDIHRPHLRHLAFGGDAHVCLGATLARLEGQIAVQRTVRRFARMSLKESNPTWSPVFAFRGLTHLRIAL
jgi:cytochrome P450